MQHRLAPTEIDSQNPHLSGLAESGECMYSTLKIIHVTFAVLSIAGFVLRGVWMFRQSANLDRRIVRVSPHVVDTAFLISGIWLVVILHLTVREQVWLIAKIAALILYIVFGTIALRRGSTMQIRGAAFAAALLTYLYIVGVALHKSPASWMTLSGS
jgi:uncharacterized membrane protein SirB2